MSITTLDPVDKLLDKADSGHLIIKNPNVLRHDYIPNRILHRNKQQELVTQSLIPLYQKSIPPNLLVYGKPGTGKTLVVNKVLKQIQDRVDKNSYRIKIAITNAKDQSNLYNVLVDLGRQLGLKSKKTPNDKLWLPSTGLSISEVFNRILYIIEKNKINTVFVIDEIDHLAKLVDKTGKDILYSITRANLKLKNGSLSLVGISNDVRFKEELDPRVISTLSEEEIVFPAYETNEIKEILEDRVPIAFEENVVSAGALNLCASMACRQHGDARRAIKLLNVAAKTAELNQANLITDEHVRLASQRIEVDKESQQLDAFSLHEKLLVITIMKSPNISTGDIYSAYKSLCKIIHQNELTQRRITQMLSEIELSGLISGRMIHQGIHGNTKKFNLTVSPELVKNTLKSKETFTEIL
ncbi:MAG: cell division control protein Cdc6 [Thaumarchaeota archaeon]|jgi:cell division control protein 6|nr:AAA family ATPase [Marine Group I thaumarchaeote]PXF28427.1 MAG: cell division control protein Cdc6 [Nitrososphaerota archaeon]